MKKYILFWCFALATFSCERADLLARGTLIIGIEGSPTNLDPRLATDAYSLRICSLIFNGLTRIDEHGEVAPDLAESWDMPNDTTYIFHLRRGVYFHHGRELTSMDVLSTLTTLKDPGFGSPLLGTFDLVESMDTPDSWTIRIHLSEPHAPFLSQLSVGIVPHGHARDKDFSSNPSGTGPFEFVRFSPGSEVVLAAHERYFRGTPRLKNVVFKIIPNDLTRVLEMRKGTIHLLQNNIPPDSVDALEHDSRLAVVKRPGSSFAYMGFNMEDPILKNPAVRLAIAYAINREDIIAHVLNGLAVPATGLLPSSHWAYEAGGETFPFDPGRAGRILDEAGYRSRDGKPRFHLSFKTSVSPLARRIGEVIVRQLGEIGIACEMTSYEWGTFFSDIKSGNFQLFTLLWVGIMDPDHYYYAFHSSSFPPIGANRVRYSSPVLDRLLEQGRRVMNKGARKRIYGRVQKILAHDLPYINLWHFFDVVAMRKELKGFVLYPGGEFYSLEKAWVETP